MTRPSFTIVIPTYQRCGLVQRSLGAIADLKYEGRWDVVVVIDGSTDATRTALEAQPWPFALRIVEQDNAGLAAARNAGARLADSDILLFLDDDMRVAPDLIDRHEAAYTPGTVAVAGWIGLDGTSEHNFVTRGVARWTEHAFAAGEEGDPFALYGGHFSVRRAAFEQVGGFDPAYTHHGGYGREDTDLAVRLLDTGRIASAPDAQAWQTHDVGLPEMIDRARRQGAADTRFARRHPRFAQPLLEKSGARRPLDRFALRSAARVPGLPQLARWSATWAAKRDGALPARLFDWARRLNWWAGTRDAGGYPLSRQVLALCYHAIADHSADPVLAPYSIPPDMFASHIQSLSARGFAFVSADTALATARGKALVPRNSVLLTFDDGYEDLADVARSVLGPNAVPALAFLVSDRLGATNEWDQPAGAHPRRLLGADGAASLCENGVELGSHSRTHADLKSLPAADLAREVERPVHDLAAAGLPTPRHFAYPFGEKDGAAKEAVRDAGYDAGWGLADRRLSPDSDIFDLPRVMMHSTDTPWRFRFKTAFPTAATILRHWPFVRRR